MHSAFRIFHYSAVFYNLEYQWNINGSPCLIRRIISAQNKLSNRSVHTSTNNKIIMYGRSILAWNFVFKRHHHLSLCLSKPYAGYERSAQSQQRLIASTSTKLFTRGEYKQYKCQLDRKKKKQKKNQGIYFPNQVSPEFPVKPLDESELFVLRWAGHHLFYGVVAGVCQRIGDVSLY